MSTIGKRNQARQVSKEKMQMYGESFRFMRQFLGYTSQQMADLIGVEDYNLRRWERGIIPNVDIKYLDRKIRNVFKGIVFNDEYLYKKYKNIHNLCNNLE